MSDLLNEMMSDSIEIMDTVAATTAMSGLDIVSQLAFEQIQLENEVEALELTLAEKKEQLKSVQEMKLPTAMQGVGINKFTTKDGFSIQVKPYYSASIKEDNQVDCFNWLINNKHDDIIKNEIKTSFGRGEDTLANKVLEVLATMHIPCTNKKSVHPQTLSAFVREQVESGNPNFPLDTFKVFIGQKAKITRSK
jgi:hypothetical protein